MGSPLPGLFPGYHYYYDNSDSPGTVTITILVAFDGRSAPRVWTRSGAAPARFPRHRQAAGVRGPERPYATAACNRKSQSAVRDRNHKPPMRAGPAAVGSPAACRVESTPGRAARAVEAAAHRRLPAHRGAAPRGRERIVAGLSIRGTPKSRIVI